MYKQSDAKQLMNKWGQYRVPFLFVVDYELKRILLYRLDKELPNSIRYRISSQERRPENFDNIDFGTCPVSYPVYKEAFEFVQQQIKAGNSFLVNLTFPSKLKTTLSLSDIFNHSNAQYNLLIDDNFVCFSPETFVKIENRRISTYPMKGTIDASIPNAENLILNCAKETAEHHTIVDLLRNDLSILAANVQVDRFRYINKVNTQKGQILQVSSEISGQLNADYSSRIGDILFSMLPAGSICGAPKRQTLWIIRSAENAERGYYTGVFGVFDGANLDSAVMIRFIEKRGEDLYFRSGGGITCNSIVEKEYQELIDKIYVPFG
jgi:para-aminobenzoate synthetase component 1